MVFLAIIWCSVGDDLKSWLKSLDAIFDFDFKSFENTWFVILISNNFLVIWRFCMPQNHVKIIYFLSYLMKTWKQLWLCRMRLFQCYLVNFFMSFCQTRWNARYDAICRILELKDKLSLFSIAGLIETPRRMSCLKSWHWSSWIKAPIEEMLHQHWLIVLIKLSDNDSHFHSWHSLTL
jgi:hypothetical protein